MLPRLPVTPASGPFSNAGTQSLQDGHSVVVHESPDASMPFISRCFRAASAHHNHFKRPNQAD